MICAVILLYMGSQVWKARKGASDLDGVLKLQAMDNIRPKERALFLPGAGLLLGAISLFAAI